MNNEGLSKLDDKVVVPREIVGKSDEGLLRSSRNECGEICSVTLDKSETNEVLSDCILECPEKDGAISSNIDNCLLYTSPSPRDS